MLNIVNDCYFKPTVFKVFGSHVYITEPVNPAMKSSHCCFELRELRTLLTNVERLRYNQLLFTFKIIIKKTSSPWAATLS